MVESPLVSAARAWVTDNYPYNRHHLLRSLDWLDQIAPESAEAVRIATLTHDMERAFPGDDSPPMTTLDDLDYIKRHSERSARIVSSWLRTQRAPAALIQQVESLILAHEFGGSLDADMVQAADSLSFLETNVELFLGFVREGRFSGGDVRGKFQHTFDRIRVSHARTLAHPMLEAAFARLAAVQQDSRAATVPGLVDTDRPAVATRPPEA
jgi:hypothetical protein